MFTTPVYEHPRSARIIVPLLCSVVLLLLGAPARAQIALVDNETNASTFANSVLLLTTNLTVSASANTLVVVTFRGNTGVSELPATWVSPFQSKEHPAGIDLTAVAIRR